MAQKQKGVADAMIEAPSFSLLLVQKALLGRKSIRKPVQKIKIRLLELPRVFWRVKP